MIYLNISTACPNDINCNGTNNFNMQFTLDSYNQYNEVMSSSPSHIKQKFAFRRLGFVAPFPSIMTTSTVSFYQRPALHIKR